jgi:hypothetical protein
MPAAVAAVSRFDARKSGSAVDDLAEPADQEISCFRMSDRQFRRPDFSEFTNRKSLDWRVPPVRDNDGSNDGVPGSHMNYTLAANRSWCRDCPGRSSGNLHSDKTGRTSPDC